MTRGGDVRPAHWELTPGAAEDLFTQLTILRQISGTSEEQEQSYINWGGESDHCWAKLILPWSDADGPLAPRSLLAKLGAHEQLQDATYERPLEDDEDDEDEEGSAFTACLKVFLSSHAESAIFYAGCDDLNPVPCFAVARVRPNLVAGFIGGVTYT